MHARESELRRTADLALAVVDRVNEQLDLDGRVERSPYGSVAAALGLGYVLGGGVFTPLTARVLGLGLKLGFRLVVVPLVTEQLVGLAQGVAAGRPPEGEPTA